MRLAGVILAGGQATRMGGGDKCLRQLGNAPILAHVIDRLAHVAPIALSANGDAARFAQFNLPVIADEMAGFQGPLAGILEGMRWAGALGASHVLSVAADTPFFPADLAELLARGLADEAADIAIACSHDVSGATHRQPTFGLWPVALSADLQAFLNAGERKIILWARQHRLALPVVARDEAFFNINTAADLSVAQTMLKGAT